LVISVLVETDAISSNVFLKDGGTSFLSQQAKFVTNNSVPDASFMI